jgi:hypothetical protein
MIFSINNTIHHNKPKTRMSGFEKMCRKVLNEAVKNKKDGCTFLLKWIGNDECIDIGRFYDQLFYEYTAKGVHLWFGGFNQ